MEVFRTHPELRFDPRYNRAGAGIGGGSDAIMFRAFLDGDFRVRYRPDMAITHSVDAWKLKRSYFLRLHYRDGRRKGRFEAPVYDQSIQGVPPFMVRQAIQKTIGALRYWFTGRPDSVRQAMNAAHVFGMMAGLRRRWKENDVNF
jgi:hypothetical protein